MSTIGKRVLEARHTALAKKVSQQQLADLVKAKWPDVEISQQSVAKLEKHANANSAALPYIAMALDISFLWLVNGKGPMRVSNFVGNTIEMHLTEREPPRYVFAGEVGTPGGHLVERLSDGTTFYAVPLLTWAQAGDPSMLTDRLAIPEQRFRCPVPCSPNAYALRVESDIGAGFTRGMLIFVDPAIVPLTDMFVIVATAAHPEPVLRQVVTDGGRHYVRPIGDARLDHARELGVDARLLGVIVCRAEMLVPAH